MRTKDILELDEQMRRAIESGDAAAVRRMVRGGFDVDQALPEGTPLVVAIAEDQPVIAKVLLSSKADANLPWHGLSPLMWACEHGRKTIANELLVHGANPNFRLARSHDWYEPGTTALMIAVKRGQRSLVQCLLDANASPAFVTEGGWSALNWACEANRSEIAKALLHLGCRPIGDVLRWPAARNDVEMVRTLIASGAEVEAVARDYTPSIDAKELVGKSMLGIAASRGAVEVMKELVNGGADMNRMVNDTSCLGWAIYGNQLKVVSFLLENGADLANGAMGKSALRIAAERDAYPIVDLLRKAEVKTNMADRTHSKSLSKKK